MRLTLPVRVPMAVIVPVPLLGLDFLGEIPLVMEIRETSDGGHPIVVSKPASEHAKVYRTIADRVWTKIEQALAAREAATPRIVIQ